jgi:hypothetical protein
MNTLQLDIVGFIGNWGYSSAHAGRQLTVITTKTAFHHGHQRINHCVWGLLRTGRPKRKQHRSAFPAGLDPDSSQPKVFEVRMLRFEDKF